jgi:hypothetical protein
MPDIGTVHIGDVGVVFIFTMYDDVGILNLSTVQSVTLAFQRPDGSIIQRLCEVVGGGTAGVVQYISQVGDLDKAGRWRMQVIARFASGNVRHSNITTVLVEGNLVT